MKFEDLVFTARPDGGKGALLFFPNGYGINIYGGIVGLYGNCLTTFEVAVLEGTAENYKASFDTGLTNETFAWQSVEQVMVIADKVAALSNSSLLKPKIQTIDIQGKSWFDRLNGNSYCSAQITLNYGMEGETTIKVPFEGGYGDYYVQISGETLNQLGHTNREKSKYGGFKTSLREWCHENNVILQTDKKEGCKKSEVREWGE